MEKIVLDSAIKFGAGRYRQEENLIACCGEEIARFGTKVYVVAGKHAWEQVSEKFCQSMKENHIEYVLQLYGGVCSHEKAKELAAECNRNHCDEVVGIGGGVIMDFAKAVGEYAKCGVINIPTSIATCAAFTTMSVMYTPKGARNGCWRFEHEIDAVLVDLNVIANCPARFAAAGILDAMAKKIEISNGKPEMRLEENKIDLFSAYRMSEYTYEVLSQNAVQVIEDITCHKVTKALADVTFINIAITGVIANITKSFSQSALGHMTYDGVRTIFTEEARLALHGEIVAVALFTQLYYNGRSRDKDTLKEFMRALNMPLSLQEIGIEESEENLRKLEEYLIDSPYVEQNEESYACLHQAMKQMCQK